MLAEIEDRIVNTSASMSALTGRLLDDLRAFDEVEGWAAAGARSFPQWLSWRVGIGVPTAREQVRVARALGGLARINSALHEGRLSYSKVRAMTRVATPENEEELLGLALLSTAAQLERICRGYRQCRQEIEGYERQPLQRKVEWWWEDGGLRFSGWLPAEEGGLVRQAILGAMDSLREEAWAGENENDRDNEIESEDEDENENENEGADGDGDGDGDGDEIDRPDVSAEAPLRLPDRADALVAIAETSIAHGLASAPGGERTQVVLHIGNGQCRVEDGPAVEVATALRLACDAQLLPVTVDEDRRVLDVGRARRTIPPAVRRALRLRDGGCRFPGCRCTRFVDAHHVVHWADGGETKLDNLVLLCRFHHRLVHDEGFDVVAIERGDMVFTDPTGRPIAPVPPTHQASGSVPVPAGLPIDGHWGRWDCAWVIQGLLEDDGLIGGRASPAG